MERHCDLDRVMLTPEALEAWQGIAARVGVAVRLLSRSDEIDPASIPDERGEIQEDGSLKILCDVPVFGELSMTIPPGGWAYRQ